MEPNPLLQKTISFVKEQLEGAESGHDWWHIYRVWSNAKLIGESEDVDMLVVELAALLHDVADSKFHGGDEELGPAIAERFLKSVGLESAQIDHIGQIIRYMSFKNTFDNRTFDSLELKVVQDADRLDAIGAIGIARAFSFGGYKLLPIYDPGIPPLHFKSKGSYKKNSGPSINHFYEKLLKLKDLMNTDKGQKMAEDRHRFMEAYLNQFYKEWPKSKS